MPPLPLMVLAEGTNDWGRTYQTRPASALHQGTGFARRCRTRPPVTAPGHRRQPPDAPPSNRITVDRYASGIGVDRRVARSIRTSVSVALHMRASSATRNAAHSTVTLVLPSRAVLVNTSSRSSNRAGASYDTDTARITNS